MKFLSPLLLLLSLSAWAKFSHESELSSVVSGGNSDVETYLYKFDNKMVLEHYSYGVNGHYNYGEAGSTVNARDWHFNIKAERMLSPRMAVYFQELVEGYRFQGIKARYNTDGGFKYYFIRGDTRNIFTEIGYRYTYEDRYPPETNQYENKGRVYSEINHQPNKNFSYKFWVEYVPNFTEREDWLLTHELSITSILTTIFSLKFAYRGIYDDQPAIPGNANYDYTYSTSFVARF